MTDVLKNKGSAVISAWKWISYYYPYTFAGSLYAAVMIYLLGTAFATGNVYAFLFSTLSLLFLVFFAFLARLQAFRMGLLQISWDSGNPILARKPGGEQILHTGDAKPFYFFRIHFVLKGILHAGRKSPLRYYREASSTAGSSIQIPFNFPVAGRLEVKGHPVLHDVFGFVRARLGHTEKRTLHVRPPVFSIKIPPRFENSISIESSKNRRSSDEEKYFMREYMPGDRLKDINWKSSSRISKLITRVSPASPERSKVIQILIRTNNPHASDCMESIMHLNFLKSWILSFMVSLQNETDSFRFVVTSDYGVFEIDDEKDIEEFSVKLAAFQYSGHEQDISWEGIAHEVVIFTTAYDRDLSHYIAQHPSVSFRIFRTARGSGRNGRKISFFRVFDPTLLPGTWIFRRQRPPAGALNAKIISEEKLIVRL